MSIKVSVGDKCCPPPFEPYKITIEIDNYEDHCTLKYLALCNTRVPATLYDRAMLCTSEKYRSRADKIRRTSKAFLISLSAKIPLRYAQE